MSSDETERLPRQRATIACAFCRQRKRRCDGKRPGCSNCESAGVNCRYVDVDQRRFDVESSLASFVERLDRLESTVGEHSDTLHQIETRSSVIHAPSTPYYSQCSDPRSQDFQGASPHGSVFSHVTTSSRRSNGALDVDSMSNLPPMTIPLWHSTTTGSLLACPLVKSVLGDYPSDIFLRTEEKRGLPVTLTVHNNANIDLPILNRVVTDRLMELYFESVNLQHPVLEYDESASLYHSILSGSESLLPNLDSALCLIVLALSEIAHTTPSAALDADWAPGSIYFLPAMSISVDTYLKCSIVTLSLPRCLYLSALYYNFLGRPLEAWRLVHMASTSFQRLWISSKHLVASDEVRQQPFIKLCWAIFVLECDLIAEHHLPRSGIENLVDTLPLPLCGDQPDHSLLAWLAELSVRRLLNRVHHAMYGEDYNFFQTETMRINTPSPNNDALDRSIRSALTVSLELDGQLNNWLDLIPHAIRPDPTLTPTTIPETLMLLRYHSAKDIIFRPFLLFVCSLPNSQTVPHSLLDICRTSIYSCRQYILGAEVRLREPCASTEIVIHSVFASTIILTIASLCHRLKDFIRDIDALQGRAISAIQQWAFPGSCIEAMLWMLTAVRNKTKMLHT